MIRRSPQAADLYAAALIVFAGIAVALTVRTSQSGSWLLWAILGVLVTAEHEVEVRLPGGVGYQLAFGLLYGAAFTVDLTPALFGLIAGHALTRLRRRKVSLGHVFNVAQGIIALSLGQWAFTAAAAVLGHTLFALFFRAAWGALVGELVSLALVSVSVVLVRHQQWLEAVTDLIASAWPTLLATVAIAGIASLTMRQQVFVGLAASALLALLFLVASRLYARFLHRRRVRHLLRQIERGEGAGLARAKRTADFALRIAEQLGLDAVAEHTLRYAALLHDVSLSRSDRAAMDRPGPLDPRVRERVLRHPVESAETIELFPQLEDVAAVVRAHQEHFDGTGYPAGLQGEQIPLLARVLAVAVAFEAMTADRPHRPRMGVEQALLELERMSGTQFDPWLAQCLAASLGQDAAGTPPVKEQVEAGEAAARPTSDEEILRSLTQLRAFLSRTTSIGQRRRRRPGPAEALEALVELFQSAELSSSIQDVAGRLARTLAQATGCPLVVALRDPTTGRVVCQAAAGFSSSPGLVGWAMAPPSDTMQIVFGRLEADLRPVGRRDRSCQTLLRAAGFTSGWRAAIPLVAEGQAVGMLVAVGHEAELRPNLGLLRLTAVPAGMALRSIQLRQAVENQLARISEMRLLQELVFEHMVSSVIVLDPAGRVILCNGLARQTWRRLGLEGDLSGSSVELLGEVSELGRLFAIQIERTGELPEEKIVIPTPDGEELHLMASAIPIADRAGDRIGTVVMWRDVTRLQEAERRAAEFERLASLGTVAAGAAHEIRNPLTSIRGFAQLLSDRVGALERRYLDIAIQEIDRIDQIVRDMLLLGRPTPPVLEPVDLTAMIEQVLEFERASRNWSHVACVVDLPPKGLLVRGDPRQLRQVFLNLVRNATEALPPAGGRIEITARRIGTSAVVSVRDNGSGIPPGDLKRIFTPFFTTKATGTGLGLAVSWQIMQAHGGSIAVCSQVGRGTEFTLTLPLAAEVEAVGGD